MEASVHRIDPEPRTAPEASVSGVSWPAVLAGAFVAAAISFVLMSLGAGMGLSSVSPWPNAGAAVSRIAPGAIAWIILVQLLSCALGGYLAGRLRTKWVSVHTHEVFFRDTAHGFLVWAVSFVVGAVLLSSLAASVARDASNARDDGRGDSNSYFVDSLFRGAPAGDVNDERLRAETKTIFAKALTEPDIVAADKSYLTSLVAARTGLAPSEASARVDQTLTEARAALDRARKAIAHSLYWLVVALLVGAFCGSYAAVVGGRQRDLVRV